MQEIIHIQGAREHNLKNVSVDIPRDKFVVFTGLSGSGKSSLAFDTIFAEGQRRYVESLSSYARQFLGQMDKPDVDFIEGLSPAVSIDQKSTNRNPRSTVGTITEIYDYLRLLYARAGIQYCPKCGEKIQAQSAEQIVNSLLESPEGTRAEILAPLVRGRKGEHLELLAELKMEGFSRVRIDGENYRIDEIPALEKNKKHTIEAVVDRIVLKTANRSRINDSVETALQLAKGIMIVSFPDASKENMQSSANAEKTDSAKKKLPENAVQRIFSENRSCPNQHQLELDEIEPRTFSFNAPYGACPDCDGIGFSLQADPDLVVPDKTKSIAQGAIMPWSLATTKKAADYFMRQLKSLGDTLDFDVHTPWQKLKESQKEAILFGHDFRVKMRYKNRWGREKEYSTGFEGVVRYVRRKYNETESDYSKERFRGYMRTVPCETCHGARLKPEVLAVRIGKLNITELTNLSIEAALKYLNSLELNAKQSKIATQVMREILARLQFLVTVGLGYLTLSRAAGTLSGGEAQRIRLATQIGSGLVGVLYVLDEPSIGLHQRDNAKLLKALLRLRDLGNTLVVVEHDEDTILAADWVLDIGPRAGEHGGEIIYSGPPAGISAVPESITGQYLTGMKKIEIPATRRKTVKSQQIKIIGASENNLKNIDVNFPIGVFTAVTGVSGSGKSSLVNKILYETLANQLNNARHVPGKYKDIHGISELDKIVHVDQAPIGRTPRSNPATYTGMWDPIRQLFASTEAAKIRGYGPGRFSFNVKGGRCESCAGDGTIKIEMNFLPDVYVPCEVCHGARYNRETLEVKYKGKNVAQVLDMTISEAKEFFQATPRILRHLEVLDSVGLGYIRLGQPATTLSGGEAQRVKLASELYKRSTGKTVYVLDEPTTGLHFEDVRKLLEVLQGLTDKGNTVIVIEHNLDVIKSADWVIDLGPEGGDGGGLVIAQGTPEEVAKEKASHTGRYLQTVLQNATTPKLVESKFTKDAKKRKTKTTKK